MRRPSRHRTRVYDALDAAAGPLSATDIHDRLRHTGIGLATVYRLLNEGVEDGELVGIDLPHGPKRFEPAARPHHHFFECVACHTVLNTTGCPGDFSDLVPDGYELQSHVVILSGRCNACVGTEPA